MIFGNPNNQFNRTDDDIGEWVNVHKNAWRLPVNINSYYRRIILNIAKRTIFILRVVILRVRLIGIRQIVLLQLRVSR